MRRRMIGTLIAALALGSPVRAADFADYVIRQLQAQGFTEFDTSTTLLGRTRIVASGDIGTREIVLNPVTGEILRDLWLLRGGDGSRAGDGRNGGRSSGRSGRSSDDDDDDDDDNSGPGGSGSDDGDDD